jgi:D-alanyl-D-alanine carboxypeptidase
MRLVPFVLLVAELALACGKRPSRDEATAMQAPDAAPAVSVDAGLASATPPDAGAQSPVDPFGPAKTSTRAACAALNDRVSEPDLKTSFVDGDDLFALVNRSPTGQLPPDWAPSDLVDVQTGKAASASDCEKVQCLRQAAATALGELLARMKKEGFPGKVESAFRSYGFQCGTFTTWMNKSSFCEASEQSALPGHSQHQLGTTVDLFTEEWAKDSRGVFRSGFGCTEAGRFLRDHAIEYGFVMPYPIHPDDRHPKQSCVTRWDIDVGINPRTGYRYEHWHIRYIGREAAERFYAAQAASGIGKPGELTLEQWLRSEKGIAGPDAELPVCDGCNCGACSTLAHREKNVCDRKGGALHLDGHGIALAADGAPEIEGVEVKTRRGRAVIDLTLNVPASTLTQPPILGSGAPRYEPDWTFAHFVPFPNTEPRAYPPLDRAWVVGVEPIPNDTKIAWPYRAAIALPAKTELYNRANVLLPARSGKVSVRVGIPPDVKSAKVVLLQGGQPHGTERTISLDAAPRKR